MELCIYVDAIASDFKTIFYELNAKNTTKKSVHLQKVTDAILKDAIILHTDMMKYDSWNHFRKFFIKKLNHWTYLK